MVPLGFNLRAVIAASHEFRGARFSVLVRFFIVTSLIEFTMGIGFPNGAVCN